VFKGWLSFNMPDTELDSMNALAEERKLAAELDRILEDSASDSENAHQPLESVETGWLRSVYTTGASLAT